MERMTYNITARRLEQEDGVKLPKLEEGRLLYVHVLFNRNLRATFVEEFLN